jgi:hypothetical protein
MIEACCEIEANSNQDSSTRGSLDRLGQKAGELSVANFNIVWPSDTDTCQA